MTPAVEEVLSLLRAASVAERRIVLSYLREEFPVHPLEREWNTTAEEILTAIARSADITLRGVRGILAEAIFEQRVLTRVVEQGWKAIQVIGEESYDFLLQRDSLRVTIQVKLQRREAQVPKIYRGAARRKLQVPNEPLFAVEVQRTRGGEVNGEKTRPYRFGDFDILAVSMHPSTGEWDRFMYTVGSWLLPRVDNPQLIEIMQPVAATPDAYWTDDLNQCITWLLSGEQRTLYNV